MSLNKHLPVLIALLGFGLVGCASSVIELSEDSAAYYEISFAKIVSDYEEMTPYKAQARNLETGKVFSVGNFPNSVAAASYAVSECEEFFKSQCILIKNNEIEVNNTVYEKSGFEDE